MKVMFLIYGWINFGSQYFIPFCEHTQRGVVDNIKVISYTMSNRILYEWRTCICTIKTLRLEMVNVENLQHVLVVKYVGCNYILGVVQDIRYYMNKLVFKIGMNFRFYRFFMASRRLLSLYSFESGFVTWFSKHVLYKECSCESGGEYGFERM